MADEMDSTHPHFTHHSTQHLHHHSISPTQLDSTPRHDTTLQTLSHHIHTWRRFCLCISTSHLSPHSLFFLSWFLPEGGGCITPTPRVGGRYLSHHTGWTGHSLDRALGNGYRALDGG